MVRPPRATRAACGATLAAHRGYTSSEPRSLAAARRTRGGGSPSKRQLLDAMLSLSPDAHPGTGGRLVTIETVDLHGAPTSLHRRTIAESMSRREISIRSRPGGPAVALGHGDAEYGSRSRNGPPSKRRDLVQVGAAGVARACRELRSSTKLRAGQRNRSAVS